MTTTYPIDPDVRIDQVHRQIDVIYRSLVLYFGVLGLSPKGLLQEYEPDSDRICALQKASLLSFEDSRHSLSHQSTQLPFDLQRDVTLRTPTTKP